MLCHAGGAISLFFFFSSVFSLGFVGFSRFAVPKSGAPDHGESEGLQFPESSVEGLPFPRASVCVLFASEAIGP